MTNKSFFSSIILLSFFVTCSVDANSGFSSDSYMFSGFEAKEEKKLPSSNQNPAFEAVPSPSLPTEKEPQKNEAERLEKNEEPPFSIEEWEEKTKSQENMQDNRFVQLFIRMIILLVGTLLFLFAGTWVLRKLVNSRLQSQNRSSRIQILERRALSPKSQIIIVQIDDRQIALAEFATGIQVLEHLDTSDKV